MKIGYSTLFLYLCTMGLWAQSPPTTSDIVQKGLVHKQQLATRSIVKNIPFENIGPSVMSGRVVATAVNPAQPTEFYVGYASGGLWHTINNGITFEPVLDTAPTLIIGAIAVDWKHNIIWVGTGENNASRSSYAGIGMLKSTDGGTTWQQVGLNDSHRIGRIIINPTNPEEVVVGVIGNLYTPNTQRGIYKTTDGGATWQQTLFIDAQTGIIDLSYAPEDFSVQYAAAWDKDRKAWNFRGNGQGSAIYKSTDAGASWTKITTQTSGFPTGQGVGRIGLAVYNSEVLYAVHDHQGHRPKTTTDGDDKGLTKDDFKTMSTKAFLALDTKKIEAFLRKNGFQKKYTAASVQDMVRTKKLQPIALAEYLEDANAILFDTPVIGAEVYRSNDGGKSWQKTHTDFLDDVFFSYGYYFGQIRVSPANKEHIYIAGVPILKSKDGGASFESMNTENVHADHHDLWINPANPMHLINGNDGGINISYDDGAHWSKANQPSVGQFYAIAVDQQTPYQVYGGLQDNGVWVGAVTAPENTAWHQSGHYPWKHIMGGDGMQVQIDQRDPNTVYTGFQFGNYFRLDRAANTRTPIQPKHALGERPYRFNWQTPILLSSHNQDILYLGAHKLMRSMDQGTSWTAISEDLTHGGKKGNVAYGTITTIAESTFQFGLLYVGSDDGRVHITKNGGETWTDISKTLPKNLWVSRVVASSHQKGRVYVSLNGYRNDDFTPYIYRSDDYGATWQQIGKEIPLSPVNVIKEDPKNADLLYVGTDNGAYVSIDRGQHWHSFVAGLPNVPVHDLVLHPTTGDLLLATHGRSIYKASMAALQQLDASVRDRKLHLFPTEKTAYNPYWGDSWSQWMPIKKVAKHLNYYAAEPSTVQVVIATKSGTVLQEFTTEAITGMNQLTYDLTLSEKGTTALLAAFPDEEITKKKNGKYYLPVGTYTVEIKGLGKTSSTELLIE